MAIIQNTTGELVRKANATFANAMFSRANKLRYAKVCGTTRSTSSVEPFTLNGSAPIPQQWKGFIDARDLKSWQMSVPNALFKSVEKIQRKSLELDQTRSLLGRIPFHAARIAQLPDFLFAKRLIQGATSNSNILTDSDGNGSYNCTFDGEEIFSTTHPAPSDSNQSNIVQGYLPDTAAEVFAQDPATTANQIQQTIAALVNQIQTTVDDHGVPFFPEFNSEENLVIFAPPCLNEGGKQLMTPGVRGGNAGGSSGATTNIGPRLIKDWVTWSFLAGVPDVENDVTTRITPTYQTQFYALVVGDIVQPWYYQRFEPPKASDVIGGDPSAEAKRMAAEAVNAGMPPNLALDMAALFAYSEINHNFNALGGNSQWESAVNETMFIAPRSWGQIFPGLWMHSWLCNPVVGS